MSRSGKKLFALLLAGLLGLSCVPSHAANEDLTNEEKQNLAKVGTWDGVTEEASLSGDYIDAAQQEVAYGHRSFFHVPWRSYMDTWDASKYFTSVGVVFNVDREEAEAAAKVLGEAGVTSARVEVGWDNLSFEDDTKMKDWNYQKLDALLTSLKNNNIRPIILLNMNSGMPNPNHPFKAKLSRAAAQGSRVVYFEDVSGIKPKYTGFRYMGEMTMYPIITEVDPATGQATLSAPLPNDAPAGEIDLVTLKYQPFSGPVFADGTDNPASRETLEGWLRYLRTVTGAATRILGTEGQPDSGFDLEVYNEYTFGYHYLNINEYYDPDLAFSKEMRYARGDHFTTGGEVLLPITVDFVSDPSNNLRGVNVISGFSNQRPRDKGSDIWPNQAGYSRHYYTGYDPYKSYIVADRPYTETTKLYVDALGMLDSERDQNNRDWSVPGSFYIPNHINAFPESNFYFYQTESVVRDAQPYPSPFFDHYRYSSPGRGQFAELWMTETNFHRGPFAQELRAAAGVTDDDPAFAQLMHHIGAKNLIRQYVFSGHKGLHTLNVYAAKSEDNGFAVIPEAFYDELEAGGYQLTESVLSRAGKQLEALRNVSDLMREGVAIDSPRPLVVEQLVEHQPRLVFEGDGTAEHPSLYHRDDFAVLPYQLDANKFAVGYYVVTRDVTKAWDESKDLLDPARYDMPEQTFELTLSNVYGEGVKVSAYDPMLDRTIPVELVAGSNDSITVKLRSTDYPRFLIIEEAKSGPVIQSPTLQQTGDGALFSFSPSIAGTATVTWGDFPVRSGGAFKLETFSDHQFETVTSVTYANGIYLRLPKVKGSWRWTGTIAPEYTELYTFIAESDNLNNVQVRINGQELFAKNAAVPGQAQIALQAGQQYEFTVTYFNEWNDREHHMELYWSSKHQAKDIVPAAQQEAGMKTWQVTANEEVRLPIPGLKPGQGVKVELSSADGVSTRYPFWNFDTKAVLYDPTPPSEPVIEPSLTGTPPTTPPVKPPVKPPVTPPVTPPVMPPVTPPATPPATPPTPPTPPSPPTPPNPGEPPAEEYADVPADHWAYEAIQAMAAKGWMTGTGAGKFEPDRELTRAEAASLLHRVLDLRYEVDVPHRYADVNEQYWAYEEIQMMRDKGIMLGRDEDVFAPREPVTREEAAQMLHNVLRLEERPDAAFRLTDVPASRWSYDAIRTLNAHGIIGGYPDHTFKPSVPITRAEMASLLHRIGDRIEQAL